MVRILNVHMMSQTFGRHFSFYHLLTILTFLLHHLLELAIWDHLLPFIPFLTNGVFHLLPLAYIPFITGATWRFR